VPLIFRFTDCSCIIGVETALVRRNETIIPPENAITKRFRNVTAKRILLCILRKKRSSNTVKAAQLQRISVHTAGSRSIDVPIKAAQPQAKANGSHKMKRSCSFWNISLRVIKVICIISNPFF